MKSPKQAVILVGDTNEDMDVKKEQKVNKLEFLEIITRLPDC